MHLSNVEEAALKAYLAPELDRLCDADPDMLADYVIALVKNGKLSGNTEDRIQHELSDFMGPNIDTFAKSFARVFNSRSYMPKSTSSDATRPPVNTSSPSRPTMDRTDTSDSVSFSSSSKHRRGDSDGSEDEDRNYKHARRSHDDRGDRGSDTGGSRHSYSPSNPTNDDRSSSSYGGGRRRRPSNDAASSDVVHFQSAAGRNHDRRSSDRSHGVGGMSSREAPIMTSGYRQREGFDQTQQQHNSNGTFGRGDQWNSQQNNHFGNDWQNRPQGDAGFRGRGGGGFGQERKRPRCRDYDQKGYCMRGDQCPYDHGEDRIVVDELPRIPFDMMGGRPMIHGGMPGMPGVDGTAAPQFFGQSGGGAMPQMHDPTMMSGAGHPHMDGMANRGGVGMRGARGASRGIRGGRGRAGAHPYASGGGPGRFPGAVSNKEKNQLVVENIPQEFNTIDQVNNYFKKFGPLTNIQVDQIARKALIQYATNEEAHAAYSSPEVIFNNRFVKVYWLPDDQQGTIVNTTLPPGDVGRGRGAGPGAGAARGAGAQGSSQTGKHSGPPSTSGPPPVLTPEKAVFMTAEKAAELEAQRAATLAKQKQLEEKLEEIQKQKELLAQRQQEEQRRMIEKVMNNKNISQKDRDLILNGLKSVAVEVTKEPIISTYHASAAASHNAAALAATVDPQKRLELLREAERLEKERLDRELEAMSKGTGEGADSVGIPGSDITSSTAEGKPSEAGAGAPDASDEQAALKAKLASLQAQAAAMGIDTHTGGYAPRGRGGFVARGRGRGAMTWTRGGARGGFTPGGGAPYRAFNLDMRTTKLSVENLEGATEETLTEHFQQFGELESVQVSADGQSAVVHFKVRKDAEMALQQGAKMSESQTLKLSWAPGTATSAAVPSTLTATTTTTIAATSAATSITAATVAAPISTITPIVTSTPDVSSAPAASSAISHNAEPELDENELAYHEDSEDEERSWKR